MKLNRENRLIIGLCTAAAILIAKLFSIQILEDKYKMDAENNSMVYSTIYPTRGIIHDRNGNILVGNKVAYDLLVTPKEVTEFDTVAFCKVLDVDIDFVREKMKEYYNNRRRIGYQSVVMLKQLINSRDSEDRPEASGNIRSMPEVIFWAMFQRWMQHFWPNILKNTNPETMQERPV